MDQIERLALIELGKLPDEDRQDDLIFTGCEWPMETVIDNFVALREYRIPPEAGGWNDQSPAWRRDMMRAMELFNHFLRKHRDQDDGPK